MTYLTIIYSGLLFWIAVFAIHRFSLVFRYYASQAKSPRPKAVLKKLPRVTIQLPVYNEPFVIERLLGAVSAINYPKDLLEIQILDDSSDQTTQIIEEFLRRTRIDAEHIRRESRQGFKAGALSEGLKTASGELIAIFDADFIPQPDFLHSVVNYFSDPEIDLVQARWDHINRTRSILTRAQALLLDGHFILEHTARCRSGCFFNFNGTAGVWRRSAIDQAGGWQGDTLTEDLDLSYRAQLAGSKFVYLTNYSVPSELPEEISSFKSQQHRWTKGTAQVFRKLTLSLLASKEPLKVKLEGMAHFAAGFCYPAIVLVGILLWPLLELQISLPQTEQLIWTGLIFDRIVVPLGLISFFVFYFAAALESRSMSSSKAPLDILNSLFACIGLSLSNSLALFEGILFNRGEFNRTPKKGNVRTGYLSYVWRPWLVWLEGLMAVYFAFAIGRLVFLGQFGAIPFLAVFFVSFAYIFSLSISSAFVSENRSLISPSAELLKMNFDQCLEKTYGLKQAYGLEKTYDSAQKRRVA